MAKELSPTPAAKPTTKASLASLTADSQALQELLAEAAEAAEGDLSDGDAMAILDKWFAEIGTAIDSKLNGYAYVIAQFKADAEALKAEEERIAKRRKTAANNADRMKWRLQEWLVANKMFKHKTATHSFTIQDGRERVEFSADLKATDLPPQFRVVEITPDKKAIGEALKAGQTVPGCALGRGDPYLVIR